MLYGSGKYTYQLIDGWAKLVEGDSFLDVISISIDSEDKVYVFNRSKRPMILYDRDGNELASWEQDICPRPHGSFLTPDGYVYVTNTLNHTVQKFTQQGKLLMNLGTKDEPSNTGYRRGLDIWESLASIKRTAGPFNQPTGIALSSTGDIFVTDGYGNARVHKFNAEGKLLFSWGELGGNPGQFRVPHNIWIDRQDRLWIADRENNRIQIFDTEGKFLDQWTDILRPTQIVMDEEETVYISEMCRRISIFTVEGKLLARWGNESHSTDAPFFVCPHTIGVDSRGDIYVGDVVMALDYADRGEKAIKKFARKR